jgi:cellulose synthase/poly-beta-1,6-N-acetylglucosamine synthase-like glycosyltransferase/ribosomal protein L40E
MDLISPILLVGSAALFAHALFSLYLLLYSWEYPERLEATRGPQTYREPSMGFTVLLPARNEERVIRATVKRIWAANYPRRLLQIIVICHSSDEGTISEVNRAIREIGSKRVRLATFSGEPINKPRALNVGFAQARHKVITVFDAEDDVDPDVFNIVNTVMLDEKTAVVQSGVQLMNFRDHWFAIHNCLEYFFWFKSRLHFHAKVGMIPLGGNTVFMRRSVVKRIGGWDDTCLTEDADIGLRLSTLGQPIRVVYDAKHVTREETPNSLASLVRQRTRWNQGFIHVLRKGSWLELPTWEQRALALYTFTYPLIQAPVTLLWPFAILAGLLLKVPVPIAMVSFLPLYAMLFQLVLMVVGAYMFAREYGLRVPLSMPFKTAATFLPYQWVLGFSAARAAYRDLHGEGNWEKTEHPGAHRRIALPSAPRLQPVPWGAARLKPVFAAARALGTWSAVRASEWRTAALTGMRAWTARAIDRIRASAASGAALANRLTDLLTGLLAASRRSAHSLVAPGGQGRLPAAVPHALPDIAPRQPAAPRRPSLAETIRATIQVPAAYIDPTAGQVAAAAQERAGTPDASACPSCGRMMPMRARFCRRCGAPSIAPKPVAVSSAPAARRMRPRPIMVLAGTLVALIASLSFLEIMLGSDQPSPGQDRQPTHIEADRPTLGWAVPGIEFTIRDDGL